MVGPDNESRILPLTEVWPGMQLKAVRGPQIPLVERVMMQNYRLENLKSEDPAPLLSGFFVLQPGEFVPARKARMISFPLTAQFEPVEVYTAETLPKGPQFAAFVNGRSLRYRGEFGHHVTVRVDDQGMQYMDFEWDKDSGDPRIVRFKEPTVENPHPEAEFVYKPPEGTFFVPIHRIQMP